ncbi:hypothetical protein F5Y03DRAFT_191062 [Xylaria venustula]|nr:hypothetical protein F5Y03DRAFT_191062 [Xylaria venustula]
MSNFRVIVLGAGPGGLFTAHALAAAGIDFVVLERQPEIVRFKGALIVIWPPFLRLMDQLGLYEQLLEYSTPFSTKTNFTHDGELLCSGRVFEALADELGYPTVGLSRGNLIRVLYENLPGRETKVRANAHAVNIETQKDGVHVHLADGTVVDGSIVIAADGVHSPTRQLIQRLGRDSSATDDLASKTPMVATFMSLFGHTRGVREDIAVGDFAESHGPGTASQSTRLDDTMYFTVLKRVDEQAAAKRSFTSEEVEKVAQELSDVTIFPGVKLKEIWPMREQANAVLLKQEEGVAEKWHHDRIVIVGDAAHKMTSINGQGALSAVLSATALVNNLQATLQKNPSPSTEDLNAAFVNYETSRTEPAGAVVKMGASLTRYITWTETGDEAKDREKSSHENMAQVAVKRFMPVFTQAPIFDFIPFEGKHGNTPWVTGSELPARPQL